MSPRLYRFDVVKQNTGMGRTSIYERIKEGKFPSPIPLEPGSRNVAWIADEIDEYVLKIIRAARPEIAASATAA